MPGNSICSVMVFSCKCVLAGESSSNITLAFNSSFSLNIVSEWISGIHAMMHQILVMLMLNHMS